MLRYKNKYYLYTCLLFASLIVTHANATVLTYNYVGNPFTESPTTFLGDSVVASVTFNDPAITNNFTGNVYESSVSQWSIQVAQLPNTKQDNTSSRHDSWPLWFHFDNGVITGWQLLAVPNNQSLPEIYTDHNSVYPFIYPTADYYLESAGNYGIITDTPGSWSLASNNTVPIIGTIWLFGSALPGLVFSFKRRKST
jgi:hypothetical protein